MRALSDQVGARLAPLGYVRAAGEEFRPHLTLARFRVPTDLRPLRTLIGPEPVGARWTVEEVVAFESILGPGGARHVPHARIPVGGDPRAIDH